MRCWQLRRAPVALKLGLIVSPTILIQIGHSRSVDIMPARLARRRSLLAREVECAFVQGYMTCLLARNNTDIDGATKN
eukprot:6534651-Pyramimonas_sp.AAC.1